MYGILTSICPKNHRNVRYIYHTWSIYGLQWTSQTIPTCGFFKDPLVIIAWLHHRTGLKRGTRRPEGRKIFSVWRVTDVVSPRFNIFVHDSTRKVLGGLVPEMLPLWSWRLMIQPPIRFCPSAWGGVLYHASHWDAFPTSWHFIAGMA